MATTPMQTIEFQSLMNFANSGKLVAVEEQGSVSEGKAIGL